MSNLITSLWTAVSGMSASQAQINTTSHNLANINTEGYTRQVNFTTDRNYYSAVTKSPYNDIGLGTMTAYIKQYRDQFYDASYRNELSREGFYSAQYEVATDLEALFGEFSGVSYQDMISEIWASMEELSKDPESAEKRTLFLNEVESLITRSQDIYSSLVEYQQSLNTNVRQTVDRINELGHLIKDYNKKITGVEVADVESANDLRDTRNVYLDELSKLVNIDYFEDPDGTVRVLIEGTEFVREHNVSELYCEVIDNDNGLLTPKWKNTGDMLYSDEKFAATNYNTDCGYLKGLLMARGSYQTNYTDMPVEPVEPEYPNRTDFIIKNEAGESKFDQDAYNVAVADYNEAYEKYREELTYYNTDVDIFNTSVDGSVVMCMMAEFDHLVSSIATAINDVLAPNKEIQVQNADGTISTMKIFDDENAPFGNDINQSKGLELITRESTPRYTEETVTIVKTDENGKIIYDGNGNPVTEQMTVLKFNEIDEENQKTQYTVKQLKMNQDIMNDNSLLALGHIDGNGGYDYSGTVIGLIDIWDDVKLALSPNSMSRYNFQDYYSVMVGELGSVTDSFKTLIESQHELVQEVDAQRQNYAGVSADEELGNLVKYQYAYVSASRYFNVVDQMLESLIGML